MKDGGSFQRISRNLKSLTGDFPTLVVAAHTLKSKTRVVDGEIVAIDEAGRPSFQALQHRSSKQSPVAFYAFDVLHRDGRDLRQEPLDQRRRELARLNWASPLVRAIARIVGGNRIGGTARWFGGSGRETSLATPDCPFVSLPNSRRAIGAKG